MAVLISDSSNPKYGTGVATVAVANGGSGYSANDVLTLTGGDGNATCTVLTVDGSGAVLTVSRTVVGSGYSAGTCATTGGGGTNCTITITVQAGLSTVNGFYTVESYNLNPAASTDPNYGYSIATVKYINATFANNGNCKGVVLFLGIANTTNAGIDRDVVVTLQEYVGSTWTDRVSVTYTANQIDNTATIYRGGNYVVPFKFATPYAVDTTASKWRFSVIQSGGTVGNWGLGEANVTTHDVAYAAWCDNTATSADTNIIIFADQVIIDKSISLGYVTRTGATRNNNISGILCSVPNPSITTMPLVWENEPLASYTLDAGAATCYVIVGTNSGMSIGTSTKRIPYLKQAILTSNLIFAPPTAFAATNSSCKHFLYVYGEIPSTKTRRTTFVGNLASGVSSLTSAETTNWVNGDKIAIGRRVTKGGSVTDAYRYSFTVTSTSGTTVNFSPSIQSSAEAKLSGGTLVLLNGYGVQINSTMIILASGIQVSGVQGAFYLSGRSGNMVNHMSGSSSYHWFFGDPTRDTANLIEYCAIDRTGQPGGATIGGIVLSRGSFTIQHVYGNNTLLLGTFVSYASTWYVPGTLTVDNCVQLNQFVNSGGLFGGVYPTLSPVIFTNNVFENSGWCYYIGGGVLSRIYNNVFWGGNGGVLGYGNVYLSNYLSAGICGNNYFDNNTVGLQIAGYVTSNVRFTGDKFGTIVANTTADIQLDGGGLVDFIFENTTLTTFSNNVAYSIAGSKLRFLNYNTSANDDRVYSPYGYLQRTGDSLADTTAHTSGSGKYAIRLQSISSTNRLELTSTIPTGDISNKTMTVAVWCKINSVNYYSGTNQLPRLTVDYDNGTTAYSQATASTDWQLLSVSFMPITSYGQITVTMSSMTDQTGSNAYVYFDDFSTLFPGGYKLDTQGMDLWANALPVTPYVATVLSALDVWTAPSSSSYGANTMGDKVRELKNPSLLVDGEIII